MTVPFRLLIAATFSTAFGPALPARELAVDARGGAAYRTLSAATAEARPGDTLVIAKGSGPYRETLYIRQSGTPGAPIVVEGNGETVTGFEPLVFQREGDVWTARLPQPFPVVITQLGVRILQDPSAGPGTFLGPIRLREDQRTVELLPGASPEGWEASKRDCAVRIADASYQTYRHLVATGGTNDGFNLHGKGTGLLFENITGCNNLDEGFSAHEEIVCEIKNGDFSSNDNGVFNIGKSVLRATGLKIHDNLGWGFGLAGEARGELTDLQSWGNGMAQIYFEPGASGTCDRVLAWPPTWTSRPWRSYTESAASKAAPSAFRGDAAHPAPERWQGTPQLATAAEASPPPRRAVIAKIPPAVPPAPATSDDSVNFTRLIRDAVKSGQPVLKLPAGIHRIDETVIVTEARNLEIDGTGTTLLMTSRRRGILYLAGGDHLTIRGLTLDYDPIPFTQGTVTKADTNSFEFEIHAGYPDLATDFSGAPAHLYTPEGRRLPEARDFYKPRLEILSPRKGIARAPDKWPATLAPGDLVVLDRREIDHANAIEIRNNTGPVLLEDITLLSSPSLAFAGRYGEAPVTFRRVTLRPGPPPAGATQPRLFSSNADAINFVQCRQGPVIEDCDISCQGDDGLNVHGCFLPVVRVVSPTRFLTVFPYGPSGFVKPLRNGDPLRLYSKPDFAITGAATLASIQTLTGTGDITGKEVMACFPTYGSAQFTVYQVDLSSPAPLAAGQWFDSPAVNGNGFIVRNSSFHDNRGRGLRLMASDGLVENNRFERITQSAISIGPELGYWREAGWAGNVRVSGNTLRDIGVDASLAANGAYVPGAIGIFVRTENDKPPYAPGNRDIVIENNTIDGCSVAGIHAYAASGLTIRNNTIRGTNRSRAAGSSDPVNHLVTTGPVSTDGVAGVTLEGNTLAP